MEASDGTDEVSDGLSRTALTVAAQLGKQVAKVVQQAHEVAAAQRADELEHDVDWDSGSAAGAHWFGEPVAEEDLHEVGRWLKEQGYIDGPGVSGGRPDPLRVKITPLGSQAIEHELPLGAPDPAPSTRADSARSG
ncbi:hypothetical protein [Agrococcus sediminis]|uniref:hypothetical protein n=1 Tax=Agrococcus sediminis TaxID=2599924 RepID=UPI0034495748